MDWVDRLQNYKDLYEILQLLQGSHLDNCKPKTLKLGWVAFHSLIFQLKCFDFQSNQYKKLAPVLSRFCNWLWLLWLAVLLVGAYARRRRRSRATWRPYSKQWVGGDMLPWFTVYFFDIGHPCYDQLTPVKSRYPLTSIT